jgi:hypothetical protein
LRPFDQPSLKEVFYSPHLDVYCLPFVESANTLLTVLMVGISVIGAPRYLSSPIAQLVLIFGISVIRWLLQVVRQSFERYH